MDLITMGTAFASFVAGKGAKAQLQTLDDLWYLVFNPITQMADKKRIENEINIVKFKEDLIDEILEIKPEHLQEPPMSILGPAIEASKYYIEEEVLRKMFAKVISTSMDSSKSDNAHHAFVEVIKQLSTRDAQNLYIFKKFDTYPIVKVISQDKNSTSHSVIKPLLFSSDLDNGIISEKDSPSISNLIRLGILSGSFENWISDDIFYEVFRKNMIFTSLKEELDSDNKVTELRRGLLTVTPFGKAFINVCL